MARNSISAIDPPKQRVFCFVTIVHMYRKRHQPINKGIPALVCVRTNKKIIVNGRQYTVLKLMYDLKGEFMPLATIRP